MTKELCKEKNKTRFFLGKLQENIQFWPKITEIMTAICVLLKIIGLIQHTVSLIVLKCFSVRYKYRLPLNRMIPAPSFH